MKKIALLLSLAMSVSAQSLPPNTTAVPGATGNQVATNADVATRVPLASGTLPGDVVIYNTTSGGQADSGIPISVTTVPREYVFGDSISFGYELTSPTNAWPYWLGRAANANVYDYAVTGQWSGQLDAEIFSAPIVTTSSSIITHMIGTNNVTIGYTSDLVSDYTMNVGSQWAWLSSLAVPKLLFNTGTVTYAGTWTHSTLFGTNDPGKYCTGTSCSATFSVTGSTIYLVTGMQNGNTAAAATLTCDGTATGATLYFAGVSGTTMASNQTGLVRVTGMTNTTHSCVVQSTSSTGNVYLEWAMGLPTGFTLPSNSPTILAEQIIQRMAGVDSGTSAYQSAQSSETGVLQGDGFSNLLYVVNSSAISTASQFNDGLHPNEYGHYVLAQPSITALNTYHSTTLSEPTYATSTAQFFEYGQENFAIGTGVFNSANTTGVDNIATGFGSQSTNTAGNYNSTYGWGTFSSGTGSNNTAVGWDALHVGGSNNVALGYNSLAQDTANSNVAVGYLSLYANTSGAGNTAIGNQACYTATAANANTTASNNTCLGANTGSASTTQWTGSFAIGAGATYNAGNIGVLGSGGVTDVYAGGTSATANLHASALIPGTIYSAAGTALPTCAVGIKGSSAIVSDATSPTFMGAYTSGGGITASVICSYNGTTYAWLTH